MPGTTPASPAAFVGPVSGMRSASPVSISHRLSVPRVPPVAQPWLFAVIRVPFPVLSGSTCFHLGMTVPPEGHLECLGTFLVPTNEGGGGGDSIGTSRVEARDGPNVLAHGTATARYNGSVVPALRPIRPPNLIPRKHQNVLV